MSLSYALANIQLRWNMNATALQEKRKGTGKLYGLTPFTPFIQEVKTNIGKLFIKMVHETFIDMANPESCLI